MSGQTQVYLLGVDSLCISYTYQKRICALLVLIWYVVWLLNCIYFNGTKYDNSTYNIHDVHAIIILLSTIANDVCF